MSALVYLLQVSACTGIFYAFYYLLLNRLTFFTINRWYLIITLVLSFIIPLLTIPVHQEYMPSMRQAMYVDAIQVVPVTTRLPIQHIPSTANPINWIGVAKIVYLLAAIALAIRLLVTVVIFFVNVKNKKSTSVGNIHIVRGNKKLSNGSFLNYIFLGDDELSADEIKQIIAHEMLHIKLFHSADRIMVKIMQVILWFNPFIYLYAHAVEENHEFEVDREMGNSSDKNKYADLLLHLSVAGQGMLYHSFSKVPLKRRITMLFTKPTNHMKKIIYLLILPVVMISCLAFAHLKSQKQFSAIDGVDKLGPHPLVLINNKEYNQDILYTINPSCISAVGIFNEPVKNVKFAKYGDKAKDGVVDIAIRKKITYLTVIEKENIIKERSVPASQFYTRLHLKENNGEKYDKIIIKDMQGGSVSTDLDATDHAIFYIDDKLYNEDEIKKLSREKISELSGESGVNAGIKTGEYGKGITAVFRFKTNKQPGVSDTGRYQPKTKPVPDKESGYNKPKVAVKTNTAKLIQKPAPQEEIRIDKPFFQRSHIEDSLGKHDKITFTLSDESISTNIPPDRKTGAFIDGEFYEETKLNTLPGSKIAGLGVSHGMLDFRKIPAGYKTSFSFRTKNSKGEVEKEVVSTKGMSQSDLERLNRDLLADEIFKRSHYPQFYSRVKFNAVDGKDHDYVICSIGKGIISIPVPLNAKTGLLIDGIFYDEEALKNLPDSATKKLELWREGFDAKKVPKDYVAAFTLRTKAEK